MCTILIHWTEPDPGEVSPGESNPGESSWGEAGVWPVVIGANRDEALDRPAEGFAARRAQGVPYLGPRDVQAGGTWLGIGGRPAGDTDLAGASGHYFVGITNRFTPTPDPTRRSRGELVTAALAAGNVATALDEAERRCARDYNPFHLVVVGAGGGGIVWSDGDTLYRRELTPGWTVVTERSFGAAPTAREPLLHELLSAPNAATALEGVLAIHAEPTFEGPCVHWDDRNYGTRSSLVLRLNAALYELSVTDGPPCRSPWHAVTERI